MTPSRAQASTPGPGRALRDWRRRRLIAAGVEPPLAARLAHDEAIDLHELLILVDRGCPPGLAARILAPLDAQAPAW